MDTSIEMKNATVSRQPKNIILFAIVVVLLIAAGWFLYNSRAPQTTDILASKTILSQSTLEETYGLRVNLIAVTGAGGFIDVRIKMVDGEKAKLLLTDPNNFPALLIDNVVLNAPADTKAQKMRFDNGGNMFIMFPNSGNAVQTGTLVTILFGDTALEPISAK